MKPSLYLETTIPSYLVARPSRDLIVASHQQLTREWWNKRQRDFDICISQLVLDEATAGDAKTAQRRLELLKPFPLLALTDEVLLLARALIEHGPIPPKAARDAAHIAVAAVHGVHFLVTWNCAHIANAEIIEKLEAVCRLHAVQCPVICTPEELMGE